MDSFIKEKVRSCGRCIRRKSNVSKSAELVNIESTSPMEIVCLDYLSLERSKEGYDNILVITDHFSRYAQAIPTRNQTAKTTARVLFDNFIVHYGFPARIHSDQGQNFLSKLILEECQIASVEKSRTTPYHPMGNRQVERFNQTLLQMLGTLEEGQKSDWKAHLPTLVHAYNATFHDSTGYSPYFLMFGRHPRLAVDAFLGLNPDTLTATTQTEYVGKLKNRLHFASQKALEESRKSAAHHKSHYDLKARSSVLQPGDRVLVRNVGLRGKNKLADRWEHKPYIVKAQPNPDIPVYEVQEDNTRSRKTRLLHRNLLLPFMGLPCSERQQTTVADQPSADIEQTDIETDNLSESVSEEDTVSSSNEESRSPLLGNTVSSGQQSPSGSIAKVDDKYVIPMRRKPGQTGVLPRRRSLSENSSSDEESTLSRPVRTRQHPTWMRSKDWLVGQVHTFTADPKEVEFL